MDLKAWFFVGVVSVLALACGDDEGDDTVGSGGASMGETSTADGSTSGGSMSGGSMSDGSMSGGSMSGGSTSGGSTADSSDSTADGGACMPAEPGRLCVRGTPGDKGEDLVEDQPLSIRIEPSGCFSSGCTITPEATCDVAVDGSELTLTAAFCIGTQGECVKPDCSGADAAECASTALPAGDYTATLGELSVSFTVPSTVEFGGLCDGSPFE